MHAVDKLAEMPNIRTAAGFLHFTVIQPQNLYHIQNIHSKIILLTINFGKYSLMNNNRIEIIAIVSVKQLEY
jgi:hypothetical protein